MREGRYWAANYGSEMRGATIWNVTEVSGPSPGHDYVQITLGQSPVTITPPSQTQLMRREGPEKYKHTNYVDYFSHFPLICTIIQSSLAQKYLNQTIAILSKQECLIKIVPEKTCSSMPLIAGSAQFGMENWGTIPWYRGEGGRDGTKRLAKHDKFAGYVSKLSIGMTIGSFCQW